MVLKEDQQILKEFDARLKRESGGVGSSIKSREIIMLTGIILVALIIAYYSTNDKKYFDYMIYSIIGGLVFLMFAKSNKVDRGFIKDPEARVKLGRILLEYQNNPSDRFYVPTGSIKIANMYDEDDMYTGDQRYWSYQVFIEDAYSRSIEFTAKVDWAGNLCHWIEGPFRKKKEKIKYILAPELQGMMQAMRGYRGKD